MNKKGWGLLNTTVLSWAKGSFKNKSVPQVSIIELLDIFLIDTADWEITFEGGYVSGIKKSFIIRKCTCWKPKVILMAQTGVAAINIDGATIHILTYTTINIQSIKFGKKIATFKWQNEIQFKKQAF